MQEENRRDIIVEASAKMSRFSNTTPEKVMAASMLGFEALGAQAGAKDLVVLWAPPAQHSRFDLLQTMAFVFSQANIQVQLIGMPEQYLAEPLSAPGAQGAQGAKVRLAQSTDVKSPSLVVYLGTGLEQVMSKFNYGTTFLANTAEATSLGATMLGKAAGGFCIGKLIADDKQISNDEPLGALPIVKYSPQLKGKHYMLGHGTIAKFEGTAGVGGDVLIRTLEMEQTGRDVHYFPSVAQVKINLADERKRGGGLLDDVLSRDYRLTAKMRKTIEAYPRYVEAAGSTPAWVPREMSAEEAKALRRKLGGL